MRFSDWFNIINIIILAAAGVNAYIYIRALNCAKSLYNTLLPQEYAPKKYIPVSEKIGPRQIMMEIQLISQRREKAFKWYIYFSNIITIFPLLGIFGTVTSLINTVDGSENLSGNFFAALTSTALGIVAAVVFKVLDCPVSAKLDECERLSDQVIAELNDMLRARSSEEDESFLSEETDMELYGRRFSDKHELGQEKKGRLIDRLLKKDEKGEKAENTESEQEKEPVHSGGSKQ